MAPEFKTSDTDLMAKSSQMIRYDEYLRMRAKYYVKNPKFVVEPDTHRRIMDGSIRTAKTVIDRGGTDDEVKRALLYMHVCVDSRLNRLNWHNARKDLHIDELVQKYAD